MTGLGTDWVEGEREKGIEDDPESQIHGWIMVPFNKIGTPMGMGGN